MLEADSENDSDRDLEGLYETKWKKIIIIIVIKITVTVLYLHDKLLI